MDGFQGREKEAVLISTSEEYMRTGHCECSHVLLTSEISTAWVSQGRETHPGCSDLYW